MRVVSIESEKNRAVFAECAAKYFKANPSAYTYADGDPVCGGLFAIRWNRFTVLVITIGLDHEPECYPTSVWLIDDLPPLKPSPST